MKSNNADLYDINMNYIDFSHCIENEIDTIISDDELDKLIKNTMSKINNKPLIKVKTRRKIYSKLSKLVAAVLIVLALSTSTIYAISKINKAFVPGKGLVESTQNNILILPEPMTIAQNGYDIEFINVNYDGKYLDVKVRSPYINKIENSDDVLYTYTAISLYNPKGERVKKITSSGEFTFEEVTQKCKFNIRSLDGYYFSFSLNEKNNGNYEKVIKEDVVIVHISELPLEESKLVFDKSKLDNFSTSNGISLLAYSKYKDGKQHIDIIYSNDKAGEEVMGYGSIIKDSKTTISLTDKYNNVYKPINSQTVYGLYDSFVFNTNEEVLGELSISSIVVSRKINSSVTIPLPKENETITYNKEFKTSEGTYIIESIKRVFDTSDNKMHVYIYLRNPELENSSIQTTFAHVELDTLNTDLASRPYSENITEYSFDYDKNLVSGNELTFVLDKAYITINGNWKLNVNKREEVFKN